jgi:hypothetical protein
MYTRIALGKNSAMDVVGGESSGVPGQLLALLPGLFVLQGWQLFMGVRMMLHCGHALLDTRGWLVCPVFNVLWQLTSVPGACSAELMSSYILS